MYNVRVRNEQASDDAGTDGQGIAARSRQGNVARRCKVRQFGSLVEAQELAKLMKSMLRLG